MAIRSAGANRHKLGGEKGLGEMFMCWRNSVLVYNERTE